MKKALAIVVLLAASGSIYAEARANLFYIKRNKNRNEVHYAVRYDEKTCKPIDSEPMYGYWLMLEKGPNVYEPIGRLERIAYGISSQSVEGDNLVVKLKAFPDRPIRVNFNKGTRCNIVPNVVISGSEAHLKQISVFAEEGFIKPTVKYVDISGIRGGAPVTEHIPR